MFLEEITSWLLLVTLQELNKATNLQVYVLEAQIIQS